MSSPEPGWGAAWGQLWHQAPDSHEILRVYNSHVGYPDSNSLVTGARGKQVSRRGEVHASDGVLVAREAVGT